MTANKKILLETIKVSFKKQCRYIKSRCWNVNNFQEYSDHTTIHGINYVFASFLNFRDRWVISTNPELFSLCHIMSSHTRDQPSSPGTLYFIVT